MHLWVSILAATASSQPAVLISTTPALIHPPRLACRSTCSVNDVELDDGSVRAYGCGCG